MHHLASHKAILGRTANTQPYNRQGEGLRLLAYPLLNPNSSQRKSRLSD